MSDDKNTPATQKQPQPLPKPNLKKFEKLIGTWKVSGGLNGTIVFAWAEGGFFLFQHFDVIREGRPIKGIEIIGQEKTPTGEMSEEIKSKFYSFTDGLILDYIYDVEGTDLKIWMHKKGSDNYMIGKFSDDGQKINIEWSYPGGGYTAAGTKTK